MHSSSPASALASDASTPLPPPDEPVHMGLPHERYLRPKFYVAAAR